MPDEIKKKDDQQPQPTREETLERENMLLRQQTTELEDLLLSVSSRPNVVVPPKEDKPDGKPGDGKKDDKSDDIVKSVVKAVDEQLLQPLKQEMAKKDFNERKADAIAEITRLRKDTKDFDLYLPEIKETAKKYPEMTMTEAYQFTKTMVGPKTPPKSQPSRQDPRDLEVQGIKPSGGDGRWSEVQKVKTRAEADKLHTAAFNDAIEEGLKAAGLDV